MKHHYLNYNQLQCELHSKQYSLGSFPQESDGWGLYCSSCGTGFCKSIRTNSWFANKNLTIPQLITIIRLLNLNAGYSTIESEAGVCYHTIIEQELAIKIQQWIDENIQLEPMFNSIEIDEAKIKWEAETIQYSFDNEGDTLKGDWIIGLVNRTHTKIYFECVQDRTADSLLDCIYDQVEDNATVYTDALSTYNGINNNSTHKIINKKVDGFCSCKNYPGTHINVNRVECAWRHLRFFLHEKHIIHPHRVPQALLEYMFKFYKGNMFNLIK